MKNPKLIALVGILSLLTACTPETHRPESDSLSSVESAPRSPTRQETPAKAQSSNVVSRPAAKANAKTGFLIVLGSWKGASPEALDVTPETFLPASPSSVSFKSTFPRAAAAPEREALRPGYGALLGGVCLDAASANAAIRALNDEGIAAYLRGYQNAQADDCPVVDEHWALGQELIHVIEAAHPNSDTEVARLISRGADVNHGRGSRTPLNLAAYANSIPIARALLSAGARVNIAQRAAQEESTLELAIRTPYGDPLELVRLLVSHGADVDAVTEGAEADPGSSPQIAAARQCRAELLQFLRSKSKIHTEVRQDQVCRDRHAPEVSANEQQAVMRLIGL